MRPEVYSDAGLLGRFFHVQNGTALVLAALGAGPVRKLLLVAVGALGDADGGEKVVRAAVGGAARRVASLRIRHDKFLSCFPSLAGKSSE
jgi:hypothetical protein